MKRTPTQQLVYRALAANPLHGALLAVYRLLEYYAEHNPRVTNTQLAEEAGFHVDHVQRCVKVLEKLGVVKQRFMNNGDLSARVLVVVRALTANSMVLLENLAEGVVKVSIKTVEVRVPRRLKAAIPPVPEGVPADLATWVFVAFEGTETRVLAPENRDLLLAETASGARSVSSSMGGRGGVVMNGSISDQQQSVEVVQPQLDLLGEGKSKPPQELVKGSLEGEQEVEGNRQRSFSWTKLSPERQAQVTEVIEYWAVQTGWASNNVHTQARRLRVNARLHKFTVEQLKKMIDAAVRDPWFRDKPNVLDLKWLFNNHERAEQLLMRARKGPGPAPKTDRRATHLAASDKPLHTESL